MVNDIDNIIKVKTQIKEYEFVTTEIYPEASLDKTISNAVIHLVPSVLSSGDMYDKESIGTGFTVQGISTEIRYSKSLNGVIKGKIYINEAGSMYAGTIIIRDCNTGQIVAKEIIEDGEFVITNLNTLLKYNIECIPIDNNIYVSKFINEYIPIEGDEKDVSIELYSQSTIRNDMYKAIYKLYNIYGNLSINASPINGIKNLSVKKIQNDVYEISGEPTLNDIAFNIIVSDIRESSISTKSIENRASLILNSADIKFGLITEDLYKNTAVTITGNPLIVDYKNDVGLSITGNNNYVSLISNNLLNLGSDEFELFFDFKILAKNNGTSVCLLSTESGTSNIAGNLCIEVQDIGLKIPFFEGTPESSGNTILIDYNFELNKEYNIKISKVNSAFNIFINNILEFSNAAFYSKSFNFASGGKLNFGYGKWYTIFDSNVVFNRFKLIKNNTFNIESPIKEIANNNILYGIFFDQKIYDNKAYNYEMSSYNIIDNKIVKTTNGIATSIKNFDGLKNIFTVEFKGQFNTSNNRQYILYNNIMRIYYENSKLYFSIYDDIFNVDIIDEYSTVTIKKAYKNISIIINNKSFNFITDYIYLSIPFYENSYILSDNINCNIFTGYIEYIIFDENIYIENHIGKILNMVTDNLDMAMDETFDYILTRPNNAVGDVIWSLISGSLPTNVTLNENGLLFGAPGNEGRYIFKLKCVDSINQVGYINYNIRVGKIVSLCHFEGSNNATTMTDLNGKNWASNSAAPLYTNIKKFGESSAYFNGSNQFWSTPYTTDFNFGRDDFTISAWVYNTLGHSSTHRVIISKRSSWGATTCAWTLMRYNNSYNKYMFEGWNGVASFGHLFGNVQLNVWEYITISRKGAYIYCGQNGNIEKFYFGFYIHDYNYQTTIGQGDANNTSNFGGYIDELKIVKGAGLYTNNFIPPNKPSDYPASIFKFAAYNVNALYKDNIINLEWSHDEYVDYYNIYLSETTMLTNNMPAPFLSQIKIKTKLITNFETKKYFIRIGSIKNGQEKISNEITVNAILHKAPYDITADSLYDGVTYNINTKNINYESINYYVSDTPFNLDNMPEPKVSNVDINNIKDTTLIADKKYYAIFSCIIDSVEHFSSQIEFTTISYLKQLVNKYNGPGIYWYDPNDLNTLFQDKAGTIPVTAPGQPVGLMKDKSGNNYHMSQATASKRPILKYDTNTKNYYLEMIAGYSRAMVSPTITYNSQQITIISKLARTNTNESMILESSANYNSYNGSYYLVSGELGLLYSANSRGTAGSDANQRANIPLNESKFDIPDMITSVHNIQTSISYIRYNGIKGANATGNKGTGNFLAYPLYIGARGETTIATDTRIYMIFAIPKELTDAEMQNAENYISNYVVSTEPS